MVVKLTPASVHFSQTSIGDTYYSCDGSIYRVEEWHDRPPWTVPIRAVRWDNGVFTAFDNRRLYSAKNVQVLSDPTHEIEVDVKGLKEEIPADMIAGRQVDGMILWRGSKEHAGRRIDGVYRLELYPAFWGAAVAFRCATQGPDWPLDGKADKPTIPRPRKPSNKAKLGSGRTLSMPPGTFEVLLTNSEAIPALESNIDNACLARNTSVILYPHPDCINYLLDNEAIRVRSFAFIASAELRAKAEDDEWDDHHEEMFKLECQIEDHFDEVWDEYVEKAYSEALKGGATEVPMYVTL